MKKNVHAMIHGSLRDETSNKSRRPTNSLASWIPQREILYDVDGWIDVTSRKHRSWHGFRHKYKYETRYFWKNEDGDATRTQKNINISMYSFIINRIILLNIQNKITGNVWIRIFFSFMKGKLQEWRRDRRKHEWGDAERHGC